MTILAGNVATPDMVQEPLISGAADIVKIGIGPGSVCTTRTMTGVGYPQLSAIIECADAAHGLRGHVCADGGCRSPGDVVKAFAAGSDFVMLGGMLAGHDECEGEWIEKEGKRVEMAFYGMSSRTALDKYAGGCRGFRHEWHEVSRYAASCKRLRAVRAWFRQVSLRLGTAFVGARFHSTKSITDFLLCDRAKHRLQQEFPIRRRCSPHCLLECRDRLQRAFEAQLPRPLFVCLGSLGHHTSDQVVS